MRTGTINRLALSSAAVILAAAVMSGCARDNTKNAQVIWHDNGTPQFINEHQTWWSYQFVYHPYANVYYEPYSKMYYWQRDDAAWMMGPTLPEWIALDHSTAQVVKLQQQHPVVQHMYTKAVTWPPHDPTRKHASAPYSPGF